MIGSVPPPGDDAGVSRLWRAMLRSPGPGQLVVAVLLALLGFAMATQFRATSSSGLASLRQSELVGVLDDVSQRDSRLRTEARALELTRDQITSGDSAAAQAEASARAVTLGILAGTVPARGPGVILTVSVAEDGALRYPTVLGAVQELRDAGAEAIQIGSARVTARSWFADTPDGISVDGEVLGSTFEITAIGDPPTLAGALDIPGGALDELARSEARGVVTQQEDLRITALRPLPAPQYASPAPQATQDPS